MTDTLKIGPYTYRTHDALTFGDYGGAGSVGLANIQVMLDQGADAADLSFSDLSGIGTSYASDTIQAIADATEPPHLLDVTGSYGGRTLYVLEREDSELIELLDSLSDYPSLDDEAVSQIEMDWEQEAWDSWLQRDLIDSLGEELEPREAEIDALDLFALYREAMEACNEYPKPEYSSVYIDVSAIAPTFGALVKAALADV